MPQLYRKYRAMVALGYSLILLFSFASGSDLPGCLFRLSVSYQACMYTPLPEVHTTVDPCSDLFGPTDFQHLCEDDVGKDEGYLGVPGPTEYPPPFRS